MSIKQLNINPLSHDKEKFMSNMQQTLNGFVRGGVVPTLAGTAIQTIYVNDVTTQDIAIAQLVQIGATARTIRTVSAGEGVIHVTFDGDPGTDHKYSWLVFKLT